MDGVGHRSDQIGDSEWFCNGFWHNFVPSFAMIIGRTKCPVGFEARLTAGAKANRIGQYRRRKIWADSFSSVPRLQDAKR